MPVQTVGAGSGLLQADTVKWPHKGGVVVTIAWAIYIVYSISATWPEFRNLKLNELGDFIGGTIAPLALIWIIVGYFLQSEELRLNRESLRVQTEELRNQVQETARLARMSERNASATEQMVRHAADDLELKQLEAVSRREPVFVSRGGRVGPGKESKRLRFMNVGETAVNVMAEDEQGGRITIRPMGAIAHGESGELVVPINADPPYRFAIEYGDRNGVRYKKIFEMLNVLDFGPAIERGD